MHPYPQLSCEYPELDSNPGTWDKPFWSFMFLPVVECILIYLLFDGMIALKAIIMQTSHKGIKWA